jgi:transcriptional regulator with XRE-family HTH domain
MARVEESLAATLGEHFRLARSSVGIRQLDVASQAGISRTMVTRMELGRGGSIGLDSWAAVANVLGVDLIAEFREPEGSSRGNVVMQCHSLVAAVARDGGWVATTETVQASPHRAPSSVETIQVRPFRGEAAVVHAWHPVPNVVAAIDALEGRQENLRRTFGSGWAVSALVLCPSSMAGRRRVTELAPRLATALPATAGDWMAALRCARSPMPSAGLLWTDHSAVRFRPAGRHPGWQRPM